MAKNDQAQLVAILSYITLVGWIIALVLNLQNKTQLGSFHLRQVLMLMIVGFVLSVLQNLFFFIPVIGGIQSFIIGILFIGLIIFWLWGLVTAIQSKTEPLPILGPLAQDWFKKL